MKRTKLDLSMLVALLGGVAILVGAQLIDGASLRALWQPTAALVVFGGTAVAVFISYPVSVVMHTGAALRQTFVRRAQPVELLLNRFFAYSQQSRRAGLLSLESEINSAPDQFLRRGLGLVVDGTTAEMCRQILEIESHTLREAAEQPAEVLETAAGYAPTLGILGAVLGLIHTMDSLTDPSRLGAGIAVAFVATVYGVGSANLLLLPLATKLRGLARQAAMSREVIIEGIVALQQGVNPRMLDQKLRGFVVNPPTERRSWRVA